MHGNINKTTNPKQSITPTRTLEVFVEIKTQIREKLFEAYSTKQSTKQE